MKKQKNSLFVSQFLQVGDLTLHYCVPQRQVSAAALPMILIHGLTVSSRYMLPTAAHLASCYPVYVPDLPGYGKSEKPDRYQNLDEMADTIAAFMNALRIPRAVLIGNSFGCQMIARFAVRHPERLQVAILLGPSMDRRARTARQEIGRWLINMLREPISLYPIVLRDFWDIGAARFLASFRYGLQDALEAYVPHIPVPTLVVRGTHDTIVPQLWAEEVTNLLPQGRLVVLPGATHDINYNSPSAVSKVIQAFLTQEVVS